MLQIGYDGYVIERPIEGELQRLNASEFLEHEPRILRLVREGCVAAILPERAMPVGRDATRCRTCEIDARSSWKRTYVPLSSTAWRMSGGAIGMLDNEEVARCFTLLPRWYCARKHSAIVYDKCHMFRYGAHCYCRRKRFSRTHAS